LKLKLIMIIGKIMDLMMTHLLALDANSKKVLFQIFTNLTKKGYVILIHKQKTLKCAQQHFETQISL
jgi:hypothetical protein